MVPSDLQNQTGSPVSLAARESLSAGDKPRRDHGFSREKGQVVNAALQGPGDSAPGTRGLPGLTLGQSSASNPDIEHADGSPEILRELLPTQVLGLLRKRGPQNVHPQICEGLLHHPGLPSGGRVPGATSP